MDCSPPGSSVHGIFQARILEWVAISFPKGSSQTRDRIPGSSTGKESICNAGDLWLIPGSGKSPGEEIGYPLQYTWASLMAQLVKSLPAVWETWVQSLAWEDPLEENMATHSDICAWRIPMDREAWWATVHVATESETPKHSSRIYIYSHH